MEKTSQLKNSVISALTDIIENRSKETCGHIERTEKYLKILVNAITEHGIYINDLKELDLDILYSAARLYDIGKIFIPESILKKPDKLTQDEFEIMKTHTIKGERVIDQIISGVSGAPDKTNIDGTAEAAAKTGTFAVSGEAYSEFLRYAKLCAGYHHERWDGKGYPRRLDRLKIPIHGRIMAVIDVYDALISERPYKKPFTPEEAAKIIIDSSGEMFDPLIADAFFESRQKFVDA